MRTKGCVDAATQFRAPLNTQGLTVGWGPKIVLYIMKSLLVNGTVDWRIEKCAQSARDAASFSRLDTHRDNVRDTLPFSHYVIDIVEELLVYTDELDEIKEIPPTCRPTRTIVPEWLLYPTSAFRSATGFTY